MSWSHARTAFPCPGTIDFPAALFTWVFHSSLNVKGWRAASGAREIADLRQIYVDLSGKLLASIRFHLLVPTYPLIQFLAVRISNSVYFFVALLDIHMYYFVVAHTALLSKKSMSAFPECLFYHNVFVVLQLTSWTHFRVFIIFFCLLRMFVYILLVFVFYLRTRQLK